VGEVEACWRQQGLAVAAYQLSLYNDAQTVLTQAAQLAQLNSNNSNSNKNNQFNYEEWIQTCKQKQSKDKAPSPSGIGRTNAVTANTAVARTVSQPCGVIGGENPATDVPKYQYYQSDKYMMIGCGLIFRRML
jgi:hypothetical protein